VSVDISVIVPTFRRVEPLKRALASALSQPGASIEIFVVDDSPESSAAEAVAGFHDERITYMKMPSPTGGFAGTVRNYALPHARGRFIHFLDDDDEVPPGHYAAAVEELAMHPRIGLVFGRVELFGPAPPALMQQQREEWATAARRARISQFFGPKICFTANQLFNITLLVSGAAILRRECVAAVGGFDPNIRRGEDAELFARVMRRFGALWVDRVTLRYGIGHPSAMRPDSVSPWTKAPEERDAHDMQLFHDIRQFGSMARTKHRKEWGSLEFFMMKVIARIMRNV
jgi:glycosyltransferase involved in cell wall biosynthesis